MHRRVLSRRGQRRRGGAARVDPLSILAQYGWPIGSLMVACYLLATDTVVMGVRLRRTEESCEKRVGEMNRRLEKEERRGDEWQKLALDVSGIGRSALNIVERHVPGGGPGS